MSASETLTVPMLGKNFYSGSEFVILKAPKNSPMVIAGYASVDVVDKQNDKITLSALRDASNNFMKSEYKNVMITHSNVQVGEVVNDWKDSNGNVLKTGVDDVGFFVVIKMREDIEKAKEVAREIRKGKLRSFSIGGQAIHKTNKYDEDIGTYKEIDKLELHEITICEDGINPEAKFEIVKQLKKGETMSTELEKALAEFSEVVNELKTQVDIRKEGEFESEAPPLETEELDMEAQDFEEDLEGEYKADEDDEEVEAMDVEEKGADSVVYGSNPTGNRNIEAGLTSRYDSEFSDYIARKSTDSTTLNLSAENLEKAYSQFKAEQEESRIYDMVKSQFESRYNHEVKVEADSIAKGKYDAQVEVQALKQEFAELRKSLVSSNDDNVIAKNVESVSGFTEDQITKIQNIADMEWEDVHDLYRDLN